MIINDIILENRALNPDELNIINVLKSKGSNAGDMFSEVGPFLTVNQFKCLARWVIAANMATVVKRKNESETFENDYLLLEFEVLFGRTNLPPFDSYYNNSGPWRGHIREYVRDDLIQLSRNLNLDIEELRGCDHMLHKLPNNIRYLYLLFTKYLDGWKDSWLLVARKIPK